MNRIIVTLGLVFLSFSAVSVYGQQACHSATQAIVSVTQKLQQEPAPKACSQKIATSNTGEAAVALAVKESGTPVNYQPENCDAKQCDLKNCDPSQCDPARCKLINCDPAQCDPKLCPPGGKASMVKSGATCQPSQCKQAQGKQSSSTI